MPRHKGDLPLNRWIYCLNPDCPNGGEPFRANSGSQRYCCKTCADAVDRKNKAAWYQRHKPAPKSRKGRPRSLAPIKYQIVCCDCSEFVRATSTVQKRCPDCRRRAELQHSHEQYWLKDRSLVPQKFCQHLGCDEPVSSWSKYCTEHWHPNRKRVRRDSYVATRPAFRRELVEQKAKRLQAAFKTVLSMPALKETTDNE
jgi:hypothetical protein